MPVSISHKANTPPSMSLLHFTFCTDNFWKPVSRNEHLLLLSPSRVSVLTVSLLIERNTTLSSFRQPHIMSLSVCPVWCFYCPKRWDWPPDFVTSSQIITCGAQKHDRDSYLFFLKDKDPCSLWSTWKHAVGLLGNLLSGPGLSMLARQNLKPVFSRPHSADNSNTEVKWLIVCLPPRLQPGRQEEILPGSERESRFTLDQVPAISRLTVCLWQPRKFPPALAWLIRTSRVISRQFKLKPSRKVNNCEGLAFISG